MNRGQGAIEYLLIIGAAVIIAVIVITLMMSLSGQGTGAVEEAGVSTTYSELELFKISQLTGVDFGKELSISDKGLGEGLVALWHFNELDCTGGTCTVVDSSGNGSDITCSQTNNTCPNASLGLWGTNGMLFDGIDDRFTIPSTTVKNISPGNGSMTIAAWFNYVNLTSCSARYCVIPGLVNTRMTNGSTPEKGFALAFFKADNGAQNYHIVTEFGDGTNMTTHPEPIVTFKTGYNHLALVRNKSDGTRKVYLNGNIIANNTSTDSTELIDDGAKPYVGFSPENWPNNGSNPYFSGTMEDIGIWHRALSDSEIETLYLKGVASSS